MGKGNFVFLLPPLLGMHNKSDAMTETLVKGDGVVFIPFKRVLKRVPLRVKTLHLLRCYAPQEVPLGCNFSIITTYSSTPK